MKLTIADITDDIAIIEAQGDSIRGIDIGRVALRCVVESLTGGAKTDIKAGRLAGYTFRGVESLGETVNYLLEPHGHDPAWVSRDGLNKDVANDTARPFAVDNVILPHECKNCGRQEIYEIRMRLLP